MSSKILILNDTTYDVIFKALEHYKKLLKSYQITRVTQRDFRLRENNMEAVRGIEVVMAEDDERMDVVTELMRSMEEA